MQALIVEDSAKLADPVFSFTVDSLDSLTSVPRVRAMSNTGVTAMFTVGSRTVTLSGLQKRKFTETKKVGPGTGDDFGRVRTSRWGLSLFYGSWSSFVGAPDTDFTTDGSKAYVVVNSAGVSRYASLSDSDIIDSEFLVTDITTNTAPAGGANSLSVTQNYTNLSNHYRHRLTFNTNGTVTLGIDRVVDDISTLVASSVQVGTGYVPGQLWNVRVQSIAGLVRCRAWLASASEPTTTWAASYPDPVPFGPGKAGIRAFLSTGATNNPTYSIGSFEITSGRWANPPVVEHDTWVRVLPSVFTGWNDDVEQWLQKAIADTTPDVLARAMSYVNGTVAVLDPQYGADRQVMGRANYGPNATDGGRVEGADFNDYIRTSWNYLTLTTPTTDINELSQQYCLDCSGYVRMVFGYWHGIPMSLTDLADVDGINLPRRSVDIGPSGPGKLIAEGIGLPPSLSGIQIGDVVSFNADAADDVAGEDSDDVEATDDHVGIFLGLDGAGNYLFISSRKTANGPSFASIGGNSYLNGTGFWASSLRHIRRF